MSCLECQADLANLPIYKGELRKFCSQSCAAIYNNKQRIRSSGTRDVSCPVCSKTVTINKHAPVASAKFQCCVVPTNLQPRFVLCDGCGKVQVQLKAYQRRGLCDQCLENGSTSLAKVYKGRVETLDPYKGCMVFGPYTRQDGRQIVTITGESIPRGKTTVSYPKYLTEVRLGKRLDPDLETVDHWDCDFNNNDSSNIRILPRVQHSIEDALRHEIITLPCVYCGNPVDVTASYINFRASQGQASPFCSRRCSGLYGTDVQNERKEKVVAEEQEVHKLKLKQVSTLK